MQCQRHPPCKQGVALLQAGRVLADARGSNSLKAYMRLLQDLAAAHVQRALQAALEASTEGQVS